MPKQTFITEPPRTLYAAVAAAYDLEPWEEALLTEALKALDRAEQARIAIGKELMVPARGGEPKAHPLLLVERDARAAFARMYRQLGLEVGAMPSRPSGASAISSFPRGARR
jgi:hypothetical protein